MSAFMQHQTIVTISTKLSVEQHYFNNDVRNWHRKIIWTVVFILGLFTYMVQSDQLMNLNS